MKAKLSIITFLLFALLSLSVVTLIEPVCAYDNSKWGYSLNPPESWAIDDSEENSGIVVFSAPSSPPTEAFLNIYVQNVQGLYPVAIIQSQYKYALSNFENFTLLSEGNQVVGSLEGYQMEYTYIDAGKERKLVQVDVVENGVSYLISQGALASQYNVVASDFESMLNSFQVTTPSPSPTVPEFPSVITITIVLTAIATVAVVFKNNLGLGKIRK